MVEGGGKREGEVVRGGKRELKIKGGGEIAVDRSTVHRDVC